MSPEERFEGLVDEFTGRPGITPPGATGGFGRAALRVHGRIFAMFVRGQLVLKLPRARVAPQPWSALAGEALEFVERK
jgi:hypothetical protein